MAQVTYNNEKIEAIYKKVVEEPNKNAVRKGCVKCPDCGGEILMIPTLRAMQEAIENHVQKHKEQLKEDPILKQQTAISIRLSLLSQVLSYACQFNVQE